jgi:Spy/CpxP family protein refolding chaperone
MVRGGCPAAGEFGRNWQLPVRSPAATLEEEQMKKTHVAALVAALVAAPAVVVAQDAPRPGGRAEAGQFRGVGPSARALAAARAELGLSGEQVQQLESIAARLQTQNRPLLEQLRALGPARGAEARAGRPAPTPEQREQMRQRMQQRREALTPEQREQMREQMRQRRDALTPEQREQMREQMQRRGVAHGEARPGFGRRLPESAQPLVQQMRANSQAAWQEAIAVLTPEQRERARELMQQRRGEARERLQRGERRDAAGWQRFRGPGARR